MPTCRYCLVQVDAAICGVPDVLFVEVEGFDTMFSEVESLEFFLELLLRIKGEVDRGVLLGGVKTVGDLSLEKKLIILTQVIRILIT